jgi:hypothetical protein
MVLDTVPPKGLIGEEQETLLSRDCEGAVTERRL